MAKKSKIVQATGVAVGLHENASARSKRIEQAMSEAITAAHKAGVTDPKEVQKRMLAARDAALKDA